MTNPTIVTNLADVRELNAQLCQPTFWEELAGTIAEAESKDIDTAASLMAEFLHDYHGSWPQIERDMDASTICNEMLTKKPFRSKATTQWITGLKVLLVRSVAH
jgi:hypothetical protein